MLMENSLPKRMTRITIADDEVHIETNNPRTIGYLYSMPHAECRTNDPRLEGVVLPRSAFRSFRYFLKPSYRKLRKELGCV